MRISDILQYFFGKREPTTEILCVHGKTAFIRNLVAAQLFTDALEDAGAGTIVCSPKAAISILASLGVDLPDEMRYWSSCKKWAFACEAIANSHPNISLSSVGSESSLTWVDGEALARGVVPLGTMIFTGSVKEDPFLEHARTTYHASTGEKWETMPGQFCSSWGRRN